MSADGRVRELWLHCGDVSAAERLFAKRRQLGNADDSCERAMDVLNVARGDPSRAEQSLQVAEETLAAAASSSIRTIASSRLAA